MKVLGHLLVAIAGSCGMVVRAQESASESVSVTVTIPVSIPLEVPAGLSFKEAAAQFCERTGITSDYAGQIEQALATRWSEIQKQNMVVSQCQTWQMAHNVYPTKDWGTLPTDARVTWLEYGCDELVPSEPPTPLVTMDVNVGGSILVLRAFQDDTVAGSVERFCKAHGISFEQNGQVLIDALLKKIAESREQQQQQKTVETAQLLFSIPIEIGGEVVQLPVHEGDMIDDLVSQFCAKYNVDINADGAVIRDAIINTANALREQLQAQANSEQQATQEQRERKKVLDVPVLVDNVQSVISIYDDDTRNSLQQTISDFCVEHGLDQENHGRLLFDRILQQTQALSQQGQ